MNLNDGTLESPQKNTLMKYLEYQKIKLYGVEITL